MDSLIEPAGAFGRFQKLNLFIIGCITSLSAMYYSLIILNYLEPNIRCKVMPGLGRNTSLFYLSILRKESDICNLWNNYTINFLENSNLNSNEKPFYTCYFNDSYNYGLNVVSEWNLVCKHRYLASICQSLFLIGTLSAFTSEKVGSRFGRKKASVAFITLLILSQIACQILISDFKYLTMNLKTEYRYIVYCVVQFLNGVLVYCMGNSTYLILIDLTTASFQQAISKINIYFFLVGELACLGLVYSVRNWRVLNAILTSLTILFFILFITIVPDSPRWCIESGRYEEAYEILKSMARLNKKKAYDSLKYKEYALKRFKSDLCETRINEYPDFEDDEIEPDIKLESEVVFRKRICFPFSRCLKFCILIVFFNCLSINFFGISLGMIYLIPVNSYLMLLFSTLSGVAGTLICNLNDKIGYKRALLTYLFLMGTSLIITAALPYDGEMNSKNWFLILKGSIYLFSKSMISAAYNTAIVISSELFDVKLRLNVMLILNCIGCFATLFTPQINLLKFLIWKPLPYLIYAFSAFISFLISYYLPVAKRLQRKKKFDLTF